MRHWILIAALLSAIPARGYEAVSGSFSTGFGQRLSAEEAESSVLFEPALAARPSALDTVELQSLIIRPTSPVVNFEVPWVTVRYWRTIPRPDNFSFRFLVQTSALSVDRWKDDGHSIRQSVGGEIGTELFERCRLLLRVAPFFQWNRYRQSAAGQDLPGYGMTESLLWIWSPGDWIFEAKLFLTQAAAGGLRNEYGTAESIGYRFVPGAVLSLSHELSTSYIDDTTGLRRPVRLFDGNESQLALSLRLEI